MAFEIMGWAVPLPTGGELFRIWLSAFAGFYIRHWASKPRLSLGGSGSSRREVGGVEHIFCQMSVLNSASFFGVALRRESAEVVSATLYDYEMERTVPGALRWGRNDQSRLQHGCTIDSGSEAHVYLFGRVRAAREYFIFNAQELGGAFTSPNSIFSDGKKVFRLDIRDSLNRSYSFNFTVISSQHGFEFKHKSLRRMSRLAYLRKALFHR